MSRLHEAFSGVAGTTDVLTFDLMPPRETTRKSGAFRPRRVIEGDIAVCVEEAMRQASRRGRDTRLEVLLYSLHGVLHLQGYDDHDADDYRKMHRREDALLRKAGIGALFESDRR